MDLIDKIEEYQLNPPKEDRLISLDDKLKELRQYIKKNKEYLDNHYKKFYIYIKNYLSDYDDDYDEEEDFPYIVINYDSFHENGYYTDDYDDEEDSEFISNIPGIVEESESMFSMIVFYKDKCYEYENDINFYERILAETYSYSKEEQIEFLCNVALELQKTGAFSIEVDPTLSLPNFDSYVSDKISDFQAELYASNIIINHLSEKVIDKIKEHFECYRLSYALNVEKFYPTELFNICSYSKNNETYKVSITSSIDNSIVFNSDMLDF